MSTATVTTPSTWSQAWASVRSHRGGYAAPFVVLALAGALLSATGVLMESGLRSDAAGMLTALAGSFAGTALLVVVLVVSSTVTLALRQRRREVALLRAIGATRAQVRRRIGAELVLLTLVAAPVGAVAGLWLARSTRGLLVDAGIVGDGFRFALSPLPVLAATTLLLPLAVLAARLAVRETLRMPPTAAVRSSVSAEEQTVGPVRRTAAVVTAAIGLVSAGSALVVPGTVGSATAATSALLLVAAAALAGPVLVAALLRRSGHLRSGRPAVGLALANSRGFSRRLATAVVPLAAALALGTVQSSVDSAVGTAAEHQLRDGLHSDLVVPTTRVDEVSSAPGVTHAYALGSTTASVRTDDEDVPGLGALSWETSSLRVLPRGGTGTAYDPGVVAGSLAALDEPRTVAVSTDARLETGHGLGDTVEVRLDDGDETALRVAAVYERGLGFGDYLVGAATAPAPADTVLVQTTDPDATRAALRADGLAASTPAAYVDESVSAGAGEQRLSLVLLLALLAFIGVAAANTLAMSTAGRRDELTLLSRTGATRRQLVTMSLVESLVVAALAWAIGTAAVVPSVIGVSVGLLGATVPVLDVTTYAVLSVAVLGISVLSIVPTAARQVRRATR